MIAFSRAEITRLNMAARERMAQDGRLGPDALQVGEREFRVGDPSSAAATPGRGWGW
jgi:hypothetical protein